MEDHANTLMEEPEVPNVPGTDIPVRAREISLMYLVFGTLWIIFSDQAVLLLVDSPEAISSIQTFKGWAFVLTSAAVIYLLVEPTMSEYEDSQRALGNAMTQIDVLNRLLRHNFRNDVNVVMGVANGLAEDDLGDDRAQMIETLQSVSESLVSKIERAAQIRRLLEQNGTRSSVTHLDDGLEKLVDEYRRSHEDGTFEVDVPDEARVHCDPLMREAIDELLENAVKHSNGDTEVKLECRKTTDSLVLTISDSGESIPDMEREALEAGEETALIHSQGMGLWFVYWVVKSSNGTLEISDNRDGEGNVVEIEIPLASTHRRRTRSSSGLRA